MSLLTSCTSSGCIRTSPPSGSRIRHGHIGTCSGSYTIEFVWVVPNDDNRMEDGRGLRLDFANDMEIPYIDEDWLYMGCSFLEMLIALSRRLAFEGGGEARGWFFLMLENLRINVKDSEWDHRTGRRIEEIVTRVVWRQYEYDGAGGLFPLDNPNRDQREVEIYYQMQAYLLERQ
jgi:hypothetical protein